MLAGEDQSIPCSLLQTSGTNESIKTLPLQCRHDDDDISVCIIIVVAAASCVHRVAAYIHLRPEERRLIGSNCGLLTEWDNETTDVELEDEGRSNDNC